MADEKAKDVEQEKKNQQDKAAAISARAAVTGQVPSPMVTRGADPAGAMPEKDVSTAEEQSKEATKAAGGKVEDDKEPSYAKGRYVVLHDKIGPHFSKGNVLDEAVIGNDVHRLIGIG